MFKLYRTRLSMLGVVFAVAAVGFAQDRLRENPDDVGKRIAKLPAYQTYLTKRNDLGSDSNAEDHAKLAAWCNENGLPEERRSHFLVAASLDPMNARWHAAVGRKARGSLGGLFMTDGEFNEAMEDIRVATNTNRDWAVRLRQAGEAHECGNKKALYDTLGKFNEPSAIPALERFGQSNSATIQNFVVNVLRRLQHHEACDSLIRHALYAKDESVRRFAADSLATRNPTRYVPRMVGWMNPDADPDEVTLPAQGIGGRHSLMWAVSVGNQAVITGLNGIGDMSKAAADLRKVQGGSTFDMRLTNRERTQRIAAALEEATGEKLGTDPDKWREWLDKLTDSFTPSGATAPPPQIVSESFGQPPPVTWVSFGVDCFAEGTPVWTRRGLVPVEQLRIGDLVMSRDMDDGTQRWQPITRTITRPPTKQVRLTIDGEKITATFGHPFRVQGRKWVFARDLKVSDSVKTHSGYLKVEETERVPDAKAYSIELANFNTYYVGTKLVLVHDNTPVYDLELEAAAKVEDK